MPWPQSQEYNEAIQSPLTSFADPELRTGEIVTNALGLPIPHSGNFADVYEMHCPNGSRWALKCFTRDVPGLRDRYQEISRYLHQVKLPFIVEFSYLEKGIRIRGGWYPLLKMQWVEGFTLDEFLGQQLEKPGMLRALLQIWRSMAVRLHDAKIAHADLQHGNVMLVPGSTANSLALKLIDYDGMLVPALASKKSGELGHPSFQHPQRMREGTYRLEVDRFPLLLIATSLRALMVDGRALWEDYHNGENLLFREQDLLAPGESELFRELQSSPDAEVRALVDLLRQALEGNLEEVPLLDDVLTELPLNAAALPILAEAKTPHLPSSLEDSPTEPQPSFTSALPDKATETQWRPGAEPPVRHAQASTGNPFENKGNRTASITPRHRKRRKKGFGSPFSLALCGGALIGLILLILGVGFGLKSLKSRGQSKENTGQTGDPAPSQVEPKPKELAPLPPDADPVVDLDNRP